jgi:KDO2-lipid IV(A) lauroyltransferase
MLSKFAYYSLLLPLSYLPLTVLYLFSNFLYLLLTFVIPYRKKLIRQNLSLCFPNQSKSEINQMHRKFMQHFCDILVEGVKNLSISEKHLLERFKIRNPEVMQELFEKNSNVLLVSGHFNNWEWLISIQNRLFPHAAVGIGMPMSNGFFDQKINAKRQRFGMQVVHAKNYKETFSLQNRPYAVLTLADQSPGDARKSYWTDFLGRPTAVLFGAENMAHQYHFAVVGFVTRKTKRGYYEMELEVLCENPRNMQWGEITELHVRQLEKAILEHPEYWLWSHNRWKRDIPADLEELKHDQREDFNRRFHQH